MRHYKVTFYSVSGKGEGTTYKQIGVPIEMLVLNTSRQHMFSMAFHRASREQKDAMKLDIIEL